jgi:hypothetical protein
VCHCLEWKAINSSERENNVVLGPSLSLWGRRIAWFSIPVITLSIFSLFSCWLSIGFVVLPCVSFFSVVIFHSSLRIMMIV